MAEKYIDASIARAEIRMLKIRGPSIQRLKAGSRLGCVARYSSGTHAGGGRVTMIVCVTTTGSDSTCVDAGRT